MTIADSAPLRPLPVYDIDKDVMRLAESYACRRGRPGSRPVYFA